MKKIVKINFLWMFLVCTNLFSQVNIPEIVPPSPNASSLAKYVEVPISHYTGLPHISVPVYEISTRDIRVPINISYHARGVKVEEIASRIGTGWTLNSGGVITRQIRGKADDKNHGYLRRNYYDTFFTSESTRQDAYTAATNNQLDLEPDLFYFNFLGITGKFLYDRRTNEPVIQSFSDIKIETVGNPKFGINGFVVTDENGVKYYFGTSKDSSRFARDREEILKQYKVTKGGATSEYNSDENDSSKYNSWYLLDIVGPTGTHIKYFYEEEIPITYRRSNDIREESASGNGFETNSYFSRVKIVQNQLKEIVFDKGKVLFNRSTVEREDLSGAFVLDNIEVYDLNSNRIKKNKFYYDYLETQTDGNVLYFLAQNEPRANKRLFLSKINELDNEEISIESHRFIYNPIKLPNRYSNSQDNWGYYNGKSNGQFLAYFNNGGSGADRTVDTLKSQAGLLTKIIYPTKGSASFYYESNKAIPPSYFKESIAISPTNPVEEKFVNIEKFRDYLNPNGTYSVPFTVSDRLVPQYDPTNGYNSSARVYVDISSPYCNELENTDCPYLVRIHKSTGEIVGPLHVTSQTTNLTPGDYILRVTPTGEDDPDDFENGFAVQINWKEYVDTEEEDDDQNKVLYTGGSRIKRIIMDDGEENTIVKTYEYKDESGKSSGKLYSLPSYFYKERLSNNLYIYHHVRYSPANILTYEQGNHGGYSHVTEYYGDESNNQGKIEYRYTTFEDTGEYYKPPYHLPMDNEWLRGLLLQAKYYKKQSSYILIKEITNRYKYGGILDSPVNLFEYEYSADDPPNMVPYIKNRDQYMLPLIQFGFSRDNFNNGEFVIPNHNDYVTYFLNGGTLNLYSTLTKDYYPNSSLTTTNTYYHNGNNHYQQTKTEIISSKNDVIVTKNFYPEDVTSISSLGGGNLSSQEFSAIDSLKSEKTNGQPGQHRMAEPIQEEIWQDGKKLSTRRTTYKDWGNGLILPEMIWTSKGTTNLKRRIQYHKYDSYGNPEELSLVNGPHIVYLWGYHGQYPIAKIENVMSYTSIPSNLITAAKNASNSRTELDLIAALKNLRNALPDAQVTTYTYKPLIGISTITNPMGEKTIYTYDTFNRLQFIKDEANKLLEEYKYHYKN
ncbi:hypothetical protein [Sinomicrobium sp. M5D2P9]